MKNLSTFKRELLQHPATREAYEDLADEFALAHELIAARTRANLSQTELARKMSTTQSVIARLESGKQVPSMRTIYRYAQAVGARLTLKLEPIASR